MDKILEEKLHQLKLYFSKFTKPAIAYSGGVDSTLLLKIGYEVFQQTITPILVDGAMLPRSEKVFAVKTAEDIGASLNIIEIDVLDNKNFEKNEKLRCYYCKKNIFTLIKETAQFLECDVLFEGSNVDDLGDYRPGLKALTELKVKSPFLEVGLTKTDIRKISRYYNLPTTDMPAMACLATRIPVGTPITIDKLKNIEEGEEILKSYGLKQYRLRHLGDLAKIECPISDFAIILNNRIGITKKIKALGFKRIALDLDGYTCGAMNGEKNG